MILLSELKGTQIGYNRAIKSTFTKEQWQLETKQTAVFLSTYK